MAKKKPPKKKKTSKSKKAAKKFPSSRPEDLSGPQYSPWAWPK